MSAELIDFIFEDAAELVIVTGIVVACLMVLKRVLR